MILDKLSRMECEAELESRVVADRVRAIKSLREILSQIDFAVEEIPMGDNDRFLGLLKSLKNGDLSDEEEKLIDEILQN